MGKLADKIAFKLFMLRVRYVGGVIHLPVPLKERVRRALSFWQLH